MLTPDYLYNVSDRAIELYEELNTWAVNDICRRLVNADWQFTGSIDWQLYKLQQSGMHLDEIVKKVAQLTKKSQKEIADIFEEATYQSQSYDNEVYRKAGLTPIDIKQSSQMLNILQATYEQTMGELKNFTRTTANASQSIFMKTVDDVYFRVISGQQSYSEAIRQAVNELASTGVVVSYPTGHKDTLETAVRRCVMTGVGQATARVSIQNAKEMETDLVLVSAHLGARPSHAEWQGKVYSISGNSKQYPKLSEATGYGTVTGLCGANCRHHFMPYIDGVSTNPYDEFDSKENEEYFNNQQTQRKKERNIRTTKRELQALDTSIEATKDEKLKFALQQDYDRKAAKLKAQMVDYREFSKNAELPMQNERLQIAGWSRNNAFNVNKGAKRYTDAIENAEGDDIIVSKMYRKGKIADRVEPMPKKQLQRITKAFKRHGGIIQMDAYTDKYLESKKAEAITYDKDTILLHTKPGRASVFEELIHATQYRLGKNDGSLKSRLQCEIEAQEKLIKYSKTYKLTQLEIQQTKKALIMYQKQLNELQESEW